MEGILYPQRCWNEKLVTHLITELLQESQTLSPGILVGGLCFHSALLKVKDGSAKRILNFLPNLKEVCDCRVGCMNF